MSERAVVFGERGALVGVLTEPAGGARPERPAVILFNVGLNHRVGPGRLNVELARALAAAGVASLRFDLSGLGDSEAAADARADAERAVADLREAMDLAARRTGAGAFVVVGLCSGTDGATDVAVADPRVCGAVFIDGYAYATPGYRARRALTKVAWALDGFRWRRFLRRRLRRLRGLEADVDPETRASEPIFDRTYPPRERFRAIMEGLLARPAQLLFVYTADAWFFNHASQFAPMVGWRTLPAGIEVARWGDVDHIFTTRAARARLVGQLVDWVERRFPAAQDAPRAAAP